MSEKQSEAQAVAERQARQAKARAALPPELPPSPAGDRPPEAIIADANGPVPRVIEQGERAPPGLRRFKARCDNYQKPPLYVLARDEASARAEYLKATGIDVDMARLERRGDKPEVPELALTALND
jgi:hypothetical protein